MKNRLKKLIRQSLSDLITDGLLPAVQLPEIQINPTRNKLHGNFACNIALVLAGLTKKKPHHVAKLIVERLSDAHFINKVEVAAPGFINFTVSADSVQQIVIDILTKGDIFGCSKLGADKSVHIESVSANPTGPLHVGHGRGAVYGSVVANLLVAVGFNVHREYYINDAGRQMDILTTSVWLRYLSFCGEQVIFPSNGYQGEYVADIARDLKQTKNNAFYHDAAGLFNNIPADEPHGGDKDKHIDGLIANTKALLGTDRYRLLFDISLSSVLAGIRRDLADFGVDYDDWFSEQSLMKSGEADKAIERLKGARALYKKDQAQWFKSTKYGDQKDRVVVRNNGQMTYFASDIAYHLNKLRRGFDIVINVWGSDHHGYVSRIKASLEAVRQDKHKLNVLLVQFAVLYRGKKKVAMSTRSGKFVTLRQLQREVGRDAARFFYVLYGADQHMKFDLELAKSQNNNNPVYYVQYAYARINSVFNKLTQHDLEWSEEQGRQYLSCLIEDKEHTLLKKLSQYPELVESAALNYAPHLLARYLIDLASDFHAYYNTHHFIVDNIELSRARLTLIAAVKQVIKNGLRIIGVSAPESM